MTTHDEPHAETPQPTKTIEEQFWSVSDKYQKLADEHAKLIEAFQLRQRNVEQLLQEKAALELHNEQCKAVVAAVVDVYDVVLPYKVLQKARVLLGRK